MYYLLEYLYTIHIVYHPRIKFIGNILLVSDSIAQLNAMLSGVTWRQPLLSAEF